MVDFEGLGGLLEQLVPNLRDISGKLLVDLASLVEGWVEVHEGSDAVVGVPDAANHLVALVEHGAGVILGVMALLHPDRGIGDLFGFEILLLHVNVELQNHVRSCRDASYVLQVLSKKRVSAPRE